MDPLDLGRNDRESGRSKRRTSILKVPRKSSVLAEAVQQDEVVECTKSTDKRISRRVSFAPANDVHLFAKDVKNTSPTRGPLQELTSAGGATPIGVQLIVNEDQQLTGLDAILTTPKQIFNLSNRARVSGSDFGEKTIMLNANDMDMTECHTINISKDKELLNTSHGFFHGRGEKTMILDKSMDMTLSQTVNMTYDQEISFSCKPTPPRVFPFTSTMGNGTEFILYSSIDKENLVPKINKSVTVKMGDANVVLGGCEDDLGVNEANPLQCLFPQEIYTEPDRRKSQSTSKDNNVTSGPTEYAPKQKVNCDTKGDDTSDKTMMLSDEMEMTQNWTSNIVVAPSVSFSMDKHLKERKIISTGSSRQLLEEQERAQDQDIKLRTGSSYKGMGTSLKTTMHPIMTDSEEENKEKTVRFSANDACMDVTSCHTVKISSEQLQPDLDSLPVSGEKTVRFTTNAGMDITQCLTVNIDRDVVHGSSVLQIQEASIGCLPAQNVDLDFENFFVSLSDQKSNANTSQVNPNKSFMKTQNNTQTVLLMNDSKMTKAPSGGAETSLNQSNVFTDLTEAHTTLRSGEAKFCHNVTQSGIPSQQRRSELGLYTHKGIENFHKFKIQRQLVNLDPEDIYRERTVRFATDDALMDVTRSHTVHISSDALPYSPVSEKTVQLDAAMDTTKCHTVNINHFCSPLQDLSHGPNFGQRTTGFCADNTMNNETKLSEINLRKYANDSKPQLNENIFPASGEKTLLFNIDDANMEVTKSHTMMIDAEPHVISDSAILTRSEDKTVLLSAEDGGMEMTQCLTSNIGFETEATQTDLSPVPACTTMTCPPALKKREPAIFTNRRCRSSSGHGLNSALKARRSVPWGNQAATSTFANGNGNISATQSHMEAKGDFNYEKCSLETSKSDGVNENISPLSVIEEKSIVEMSQKEESLENGCISVTEALFAQIPTQTISDDHQELVVKYFIPSAEECSNEEPVSKCEVEIKIQSSSSQIHNKHDDEREVEEKSQGSRASMEKDSNVVNSQKSRRRSLADIQSKMKRLSQMLSAPPDILEDSNTLIPSLNAEHSVEAHKTRSAAENEPGANVDTVKGGNELDDAQEEPLCVPTTPYRLETKHLMSQLSVGGIKPKLPRRSKSEEAKTSDCGLAQVTGYSSKTLNVQGQNQVGDFDLNVSDINDEVLGSYEDVSDSLDTNSMEKEANIISVHDEFELDQELIDEVFEEEIALVNERKRPLPDVENMTEDEKRRKSCNETNILDSQTCTMEADNIAATSTQTADSSNCSQTVSLRGEATFDSSSKQSLFESQLEDYANDIQRKFDDGTLTMAEFFKLFHIDFVIHNPRQSVVPGRAPFETESTLLDLSHDRHISLPKQLVYEANVQNLTEQVEGFKVRMRDLDKPLTLVNRALREEMEHFSEAEFKSFGAKLKERHSLYRKMSKAQSHEMKGLLYSDLIQANVEEQHKLKGSIEKADAMLKNLDDCIADLEADLATVEDDIRSHQEELNKVTDALAKNEKSTLELEIEKKQSVNKVRRVKEETKNLEKHLDMLHTLNEWKLVEIRGTCVIYTFLHETLHLVVVYEEAKENEEERTIADISFKHLLDERSQCHARLVHTLLSQFTQDKSLTKKYSTSKYVPQLLHDISLVVSRCRQLGEELRQLKAWGSLRFDILDIHCLHSEVCIIFSSLKKFAKFEIVFSVSLINQHCALELKSFNNIIGTTTIQQIEEIIASSTPGQKYLTRTIKNIHSSLLC